MHSTHSLALCHMSDVVLSTLPLALKCVHKIARNHVLCLSAHRHMVMDSASSCCRGQLQQQPKGNLLSYKSLQLLLISSYCLVQLSHSQEDCHGHQSALLLSLSMPLLQYSMPMEEGTLKVSQGCLLIFLHSQSTLFLPLMKQLGIQA